MLEIKHHLSDQLLMAYSAGLLSEGFGLVVATHASLCETCRATLESFDAVGGTLLEESIAPLDPDALTKTLKRIAHQDTKPSSKPVRVVDDVVPAPLQDYVSNLSQVKWSRVGGGVQQCVLKTKGAATARLLRIPAGKAVPGHSHQGMELTLVLQGAFQDEFASFHRGDVEIANEDLHHKPIAAEGADCICLAATDAPLKFSGVVPKIAQRFLQI